MAEVNENGGACLSAHAELSKGRDLWIVEPDETRSSLDSEQYCRRARSAGSNEYRQFLSVARGSNFELQTQLEIARALVKGDSKLIDEAEGLSHEVGKMIYGILGAIKSKGRMN